MNNFTVIVPLYFNVPELYLVINNCLTSLLEHYPDVQTVVVDDGSPLDASHWYPDIKHEVNTGFTKTVNDGLEYWYENNLSTVAVVANDDLIFHQGCLDRYNDVEGLGVWFPNTIDGGDLKTFGSIWGITRETYKKIGGLNESMKHFYSDKEYYERAVKNKVPITKWSDIVLNHIESATYKTLPKSHLMEEDLKNFKRIK